MGATPLLPHPESEANPFATRKQCSLLPEMKNDPVWDRFPDLAEGVGFAYILQAAVSLVGETLRIPPASNARSFLK